MNNEIIIRSRALALAFSVTALLLGAATVVTAATGPATPAESAQDRDAWHIAKLHDSLKVTPALETLWQGVADIMRANDGKIDTLTKERHDKAATMSAVDDLRSYAALTEAHAAGTRNFLPAFEALYQAMTAEQQANADQVFRAVGSRHHTKAP